MIKKIFISLLFAGYFCFDVHAFNIAVGKDLGKNEVKVFAEQDFVVYDIKNNLTYCFPSDKAYNIKLENSQFVFNKKRMGTDLSFLHMSKGVRVNGITYRGNIRIKKGLSFNIVLIEDMNIEKYLLGVLRCEMGAGWPIEAYKAQAVVARTYAIRNMQKHNNEGYNLCASVHCQVYRPDAVFDPVIYQAVEETKGEIAEYDGHPAETFFFACCGGSTAEVEYIWNDVDAKESSPYLKHVSCGYCNNAPHYSWERSISIGKIKTALKKMGYSAGDRKLKKIIIIGKDDSGRAKELEFEFKGKSIKVKANKFRMAVDPELLRSTKIRKISKNGDSFVFYGNGWGHGVGLCQWGAKGMAEDGCGYRTIIKKYYPGTRVVEYDREK